MRLRLGILALVVGSALSSPGSAPGPEDSCEDEKLQDIHTLHAFAAETKAPAAPVWLNRDPLQ